MSKKKKERGLEFCDICGLCKANCPVFKVTGNETEGPRGRSIMSKNDIKDQRFYMCSLCGACKVECPTSINTVEEFIKFREKMVKAGIETKVNKKMIENIKEHGNPFGKLKKGKLPKELFCC